MPCKNTGWSGDDDALGRGAACQCQRALSICCCGHRCSCWLGGALLPTGRRQRPMWTLGMIRLLLVCCWPWRWSGPSGPGTGWKPCWRSRKEQPAEAIAGLRTLVDEYPEFAAAHYNLGCLLLAGDTAAAARHLFGQSDQGPGAGRSRGTQPVAGSVRPRPGRVRFAGGRSRLVAAAGRSRVSEESGHLAPDSDPASRCSPVGGRGRGAALAARTGTGPTSLGRRTLAASAGRCRW